MGRHRRTISINGALYQRLAARCAELGVSVSGVVERLLEVDLASVARHEQPREIVRPTPEQIAARRPVVAPRYVDGFCANDCEHAGPFVERDGYVFCVRCVTQPACERRGPERGYEPGGGLLSVTDSRVGARRAMGDAEYERTTRMDSMLGSLSPDGPDGES